jgi:hypothetical protein
MHSQNDQTNKTTLLANGLLQMLHDLILQLFPF